MTEEPSPVVPEEEVSFQDQPTSDDRLWTLLAYVLTPIVPIILLLMEDKKNRPFIKAHNMQALIWGIFNLIVGTVLSIVLIFCPGVPSLILWLIGCYWGYQSYQGKMVNIPVITNLVRNQGWA